MTQVSQAVIKYNSISLVSATSRERSLESNQRTI